MGLSFLVPANGQRGNVLLAARGVHELEASGQCARLARLAPAHAVTRQDGTVKTDLRFALWLAAGMLVPSEEVKAMRIHRYLVGPERLGARGNPEMTEESAKAYSVHSFRIFLACALLAAKCPRWLIKRMLRWRGDESLEIYARVNDDEWADWGGQAVHAHVDSSIVPRLPNLDFTQTQQQAFLDVANAMLGLSASAARASAEN